MLFFAISQSSIYGFCKLLHLTEFTMDCSHHLECTSFASSVCKWLFPILCMVSVELVAQPFLHQVCKTVG